jgi:DNA-binding transcriptional MocR family regulator
VRLAQIDGLRHVIFVSSFTKLIGPALRVGYIAADPAMIARIVERKVLSVLTHSALLESFVAEVLDSGRYRKHLETLRSRLSRLRRDSIAALTGAGITFEGPAGEGIFLWGRVPDTTAIDELVRGAREQSILLAKGALFSPSKGSRQWLRFNVAHSTAPALIRYLKSAA